MWVYLKSGIPHAEPGTFRQFSHVIEHDIIVEFYTNDFQWTFERKEHEQKYYNSTGVEKALNALIY